MCSRFVGPIEMRFFNLAGRGRRLDILASMKEMQSLCLPLAAFGLLVGCGGSDPFQNSEINAVVANATEVTIYALHPHTQAEGKGDEQPAEKSFHSYPILGSASLKADDIQTATTALRQGLSEADRSSDCFWPRHGLRFEHAGRTYDFVICFECHHVYVYRDGERLESLLTDEAPQQTFDDILSKHKVALPPSRK